MAPENGPQGALDDAGENGDLQAAEHEQVDETSRDQRLFQPGRNAFANAEHDSEEHRGVRRGNRRVQRGGVPRAQPTGDCSEAAL